MAVRRTVEMKVIKRIMFAFLGMAFFLAGYILAYLYFVHPMPVRLDPSKPELVEPVFRTVNHNIIRLFQPAIAVDQELFSDRWELNHFQLPTTNLAGLRQMSPFRARLESVGRTTPYNTKISTLHLGLRLETGYSLQIIEPNATEQMFAVAGSLMDTRLHEFPDSWFDAKVAK
jgi:hypothetical protein